MVTNKASESNKHVVLITVFGGVLVIALAVWLVFLVRDLLVTNKTNQNQDSNSRTTTTGRSGKTWSYQIDKLSISKYSIKVGAASDHTGAELMLSATGCNQMSATVSQVKDDLSSTSTIAADGITYYLNGPISTLMACEGEKATWDVAAHTKLIDIFKSLQLEN